MPKVHSILAKIQYFLMPYARICYRYPLCAGFFLSIFSSCYLIVDYAVINKSSLELLWKIQQTDAVNITQFGHFIRSLSRWLDIDIVTSGHVLMVFSHALLMALLLMISKQLFFSKMTQWALIFLVLSNASYDDFRTYIIVEPIFWCTWLLAIYLLLLFYRSKTVLAIFMWFALFLIGTKLAVASWFWLLFFPVGALFWKPWRHKIVSYALFFYALMTCILLFMYFKGSTTLPDILSIAVDSRSSLGDVLGLNQSHWITENNSMMAGLFVFSGAISLISVRAIIAFGFASTILAIYAFLKKQHKIIDEERLKVLIYIIAFDLFISVILFILKKDSGSLVSFSVCLLLFLFAALGLSYVFKKIITGNYSRLTTLVIVWCLVAYFASGMIIFGPRQGYLRKAGEYAHQLKDAPIYSDNQFFLFYSGNNPQRITTFDELPFIDDRNFYYAYYKNRKDILPIALKNYVPYRDDFSNPRGDKLIIYRFPQ